MATSPEAGPLLGFSKLAFDFVAFLQALLVSRALHQPLPCPLGAGRFCVR